MPSHPHNFFLATWEGFSPELDPLLKAEELAEELAEEQKSRRAELG